MKVFLFFILTFTVCLDFTAASVIDLNSSSDCEGISTCNDVDLHAESNQDHENENHEHHCHCHKGHSHSAITYTVENTFKPSPLKSSIRYPFLQKGQLQNYFPETVRPPIA